MGERRIWANRAAAGQDVARLALVGEEAYTNIGDQPFQQCRMQPHRRQVCVYSVRCVCTLSARIAVNCVDMCSEYLRAHQVKRCGHASWVFAGAECVQDKALMAPDAQAPAVVVGSAMRALWRRFATAARTFCRTGCEALRP